MTTDSLPPGCLPTAHFAELAAWSARDAQERRLVMALCVARVAGLDLFDLSAPAEWGRWQQAVALALQDRLPEAAALSVIGSGDFAVLLPGTTLEALEAQLAALTVPQLSLELPGAAMPMSLSVGFGIAFGGDVLVSPPDQPWRIAMQRLPG